MFKLTVLVVTIALAAVAALGQAPTLQIVTPDGPTLPADLYYGNVKVKPLRLRPGTNLVITIDDSDFFVNQNYVDFLNRFPDPNGFAYWNDKLTACGANQSCIFNTRVEVSNAFFFEAEFQQTGAFTYRLYRAAFGNAQPFPDPIPDPQNPGEENKLPLYSKFKADRQKVIGGADLAQQQLDLANEFVLRNEFLNKYPANQTLGQFVDAILLTINNDLHVDLTSQTAALNALGSRGAVLYRLADDNLATNPINNRPLIDTEYNRAFVYTEYGGYLRRDSDVAGFLFWLNKVNAGPLRDTSKQHSMVCSFINSQEYQFRFGTTANHQSVDCASVFP